MNLITPEEMLKMSGMTLESLPSLTPFTESSLSSITPMISEESIEPATQSMPPMEMAPPIEFTPAPGFIAFNASQSFDGTFSYELGGVTYSFQRFKIYEDTDLDSILQHFPLPDFACGMRGSSNIEYTIEQSTASGTYILYTMVVVPR
jgi:hypothetical protein